MEEFNAVLKEDKDGWLEENNELFPIDFVRPLKRQLSLDIDIKPLIVPGPEVVNNTQLFDPSQLMPLKKRSAEVEGKNLIIAFCDSVSDVVIKNYLLITDI